MDRLKSVVNRGRSLRVPGLFGDKDSSKEQHQWGLPGRPRSVSATLPSRSDGASNEATLGHGTVLQNPIPSIAVWPSEPVDETVTSNANGAGWVSTYGSTITPLQGSSDAEQEH